MKRKNSGQVLVLLMFFVLIAIAYTSAAIMIIAINSLAASRVERGIVASSLVESGAEDALMRLLRDPEYTGGTFNFEEGDVNVNVVDGAAKSVTIEAQAGDFKRVLEVEAGFVNNVFKVTSWKEVF